MKKPLKYLGYGLIAFTIIGIIAVATDNSSATDTKNDNSKHASDVQYTVSDKKTTGDQLDYKLIIEDRASKESLIETVRKLRLQSNWNEKLVCFFYIGGYSTAHAWASVAYLPQCQECETDKDADDVPVRYELLGVTKAFADTLQALSFDSIENKRMIGNYIEDVFKCKTELYFIGDDESKILLAQVYTTGNLIQWLKLKKVGGQKRYYYQDQDDDPGNEDYIMIDESQPLVYYKDHNNKLWQTYRYKYK